MDSDPYGHPRVPYRGYYDKESCIKRRKWAEQFSLTSLECTGEWWTNEGENKSASCLKLKGNIENPIGLAKVPIGLVGPILINGLHAKGYILCPFATTEGALVASATRGAAALTRSGGVKCRIIEQVMIRAPAFFMSSIEDAECLYSWALANFKALQLQAKLYSEYAFLQEVKPHRFGRTIVIAFKYQTSDAAGQNMVTTATWHICKWLLQAITKDIPSIKIRKFIIDSQISGDKKIAFANLLSTRGTYAIAEAWIPESVFENTFKTTVNEFLSTYQLLLHGANRIGSVGFNINVANAIAAIFIATGQDAACVAESSSANLIIESWTNKEEGESGVYASLMMPSLIIGTVGGGTSLPTQQESLKLMNCYGPGNVDRLGEIIVSVALGLDISTLASVANGTFAISHEKLGRNKPDNGLKDDHIDVNFFKPLFKANEEIISLEKFNVNTGNSIISAITKSEVKKKIGHFGYLLKYSDKQNSEQYLPVVIKSKPLDTETCNLINKMALNCGFTLGEVHDKNKMETGFKNCHIREINLASLEDDILIEFSPKVYHTVMDTEKDIYVIIMEYLQDKSFSVLNKANDISEWSISHMKVVLRDLAKLHAHFFLKKEWLYSTSWLEENSMEKMKSLQPLWLSLLKHAELEFPQFWTNERVRFLNVAISEISQLWAAYDSAPKTLVHNDCNPRNLCLRKSALVVSEDNGSIPYKDARTLCLYDWELARIDVPQRDVVEFLAFALEPTADPSVRMDLIEFYRKHFEYFSGISYPIEKFLIDYDVACLDFATNRLLYYTMAHTYKDYYFLPRVVESHFAYILSTIPSKTFSKILVKAKL